MDREKSAKLSLMVEVDEQSEKILETKFNVIKYSKAAGIKETITENDLIKYLEKNKPEVAVIEVEPFTENVIKKALPELKMIACARATPVNIDLEACKKYGVKVSNAPGRNALAVAEMTLAFILSLARYIPQAHHELKCKRMTLKPGTPLNPNEKDVIWQHPELKQNPYLLYRGIEISEKILGLIGFGIIGKVLSPKAKALGMDVIVYDPFVEEKEIEKYGAKKTKLENLLETADFVSMHAKTTPETINMMGENEFKKMKKTAYFINTARGALVDQNALLKALKEKNIAGAALDVYDYEPQYSDSPLLELDNIIMTPHIGGATKDVIKHHSRMLVSNVLAYIENNKLPNQVV